VGVNQRLDVVAQGLPSRLIEGFERLERRPVVGATEANALPVADRQFAKTGSICRARSEGLTDFDARYSCDPRVNPAAEKFFNTPKSRI